MISITRSLGAVIGFSLMEEILDHKIKPLDHHVPPLDHKIKPLDHKIKPLDYKIKPLDSRRSVFNKNGKLVYIK